MRVGQVVRHGDVVIQRIAEPEDASKLRSVDRDERGRLLLALGEVTGHAHAVAEREASLYELVDTSDMTERFLRVEAEFATVTHEEHAPIVLPEGWFRSWVKREYDPVEERRVAD